MDISRGEKLEFDINSLKMLNQYSDISEEEEVTIQCYGLEEVVIEKMAALMGRTLPRDLYDFEYLTNTEGIDLSGDQTINEFSDICKTDLENIFFVIDGSSEIKDGKTFQIPSMMQTGKKDGMLVLDDSIEELLKADIISAKDACAIAVKPERFKMQLDKEEKEQEA